MRGAAPDMGAAGLAAGSLGRQLRRGIRKEAKMTVKGRVIYVGQSNGQGVRIGAKSPDGLTWWWTLPKGAKVPRKGDTVVVPQGAKPEPGRGAAVKPGVDPEVRRMVRAAALKAAALALSGTAPKPEAIIALAEKLETWLRK